MTVATAPEREVLPYFVTEFLGGEWVTYQPTRFEVSEHVCSEDEDDEEVAA